MDIASLGADSAVPGVNRNAVYAQNWIVPQESVVDVFTDYVLRLLERKRSNQNESDSLISTRDKLLPKLLSGELSVSQA